MASGPVEIFHPIIHDIRLLYEPPMCGPPSSHRTASSVHDRTDSETEQDPGEPPWRAQGSSGPLHSLETRGSREEGGHRRYDIPLLTRAFEWPSPEQDERPRFPPRFSPGVEPPHTPSIDPPSGPGSVQSHHEGSESRLLRLPPQAERHHSAPLYGSDDWERRMSFGKLPPPGNQPEGSSSRVVLPPVRDLLGELGMLSPEQYERVPVLPQLRLPEERAPREEEERVRGRSGKKGRVEMGEEGEEKRPVARKIYVACDFCRGRKLRCDGGRPRCFNCETRSLVCTYQEHPRRRGPGKAPKGTRARRPRKKGGGEDPDMAGPSGTL